MLGGSPAPCPSSSAGAVFVTGASGGIGGAISCAFASLGWYVGLHYCHNKRGGEDTLRSVVGAGGSGDLYQADIREAHAVRQAVESFCRRAGRPTVFVCNSGVAVSRLMLRHHEK